MNIADIIILKFPGVDMERQVMVQDDGDGVHYIAKWDDSLGPKPDQATLDQWGIEVEPLRQEQQIREKRRAEYPPIGDQLDALYKAMGAGTLPKVPGFFDLIKQVKDKYPKPKGE